MAILAERPDVDVVTGNAWYLGSRLDGQLARPCPDPRPAPDLAHIIADETAIFIMTVFRRRVVDAIGGFDESFRTNEDYDYWLRAAAAGFRFARNDRPLGRYRRRDDSLSASEVRMLQGILHVYRKIRALVAGRPAGRAPRSPGRAVRTGVARRRGPGRARERATPARSVRPSPACTAGAGARAWPQRGCSRAGAGLLARAYQWRRARLEVHA
jgi:hypothetical protein